MECSINYDCISYICLYGIFSRLADLVVAFLQYKVMRLACGTQIFERYNMESICIHEYYKKKFFFFGQNITKNSFYRDVYPACHTWINHIQNHGWIISSTAPLHITRVLWKDILYISFYFQTIAINNIVDSLLNILHLLNIYIYIYIKSKIQPRTFSMTFAPNDISIYIISLGDGLMGDVKGRVQTWFLGFSGKLSKTK